MSPRNETLGDSRRHSSRAVRTQAPSVNYKRAGREQRVGSRVGRKNAINGLTFCTVVGNYMADVATTCVNMGATCGNVSAFESHSGVSSV